MKQPNSNIGTILENVLDQHSTCISFESVWNKQIKNGRLVFGLRKTVLLALITVLTLFSVGFASYAIFKKVDKTDYPFINDSRVIGKWNAIDFVKKIEDFNTDKKSWKDTLYLSSLVFIKDGKMLYAVENGNLAPTSFSWTKDLILNKQDKTAGKYEIKEIYGNTYMFFEWKSGDYSFRNAKPYYYVLKKADSEDYSNFKITRIKEDKTDYLFIDDDRIKGEWESVDFVKTVDSFKTGVKSSLEDLYLTKLDIEANGRLTVTTTSGRIPGSSISWTKGLMVNKIEKTASKYVIKEINGTTYMFFEWKNGDYVFSGMDPQYYVLRKVE